MPSHSAAQRRLAFVLLSVLFGAPRAVHAAELSWSAPAECGSAAELSAQVESLIHAPLSAVVDLDFEVRIQPAAHGGFKLWLGTRSHADGATRARELSGAECRDVVEAAAVAIALAITGANPEPAPPAAVSGEPVSATPASAPLPPPAAAPAPLRFGVAASAVLDAGVLPSAAPGVALELGLRWKLLHAIAQGAFFPEQTQRVGDGSRGGQFGLGSGALLRARSGRCRALPLSAAAASSWRAVGEGRRREQPTPAHARAAEPARGARRKLASQRRHRHFRESWRELPAAARHLRVGPG